MSINPCFGAEFRKHRIAAGVKAKDVAAKLDKSKSWITEVEKGRIEFSYQDSVAMAQVLHGTPDAIFLPDQSTSEASAL